MGYSDSSNNMFRIRQWSTKLLFADSFFADLYWKVNKSIPQNHFVCTIVAVLCGHCSSLVASSIPARRSGGFNWYYRRVNGRILGILRLGAILAICYFHRPFESTNVKFNHLDKTQYSGMRSVCCYTLIKLSKAGLAKNIAARGIALFWLMKRNNGSRTFVSDHCLRNWNFAEMKFCLRYRIFTNFRHFMLQLRALGKGSCEHLFVASQIYGKRHLSASMHYHNITVPSLASSSTLSHLWSSELHEFRPCLHLACI